MAIQHCDRRHMEKRFSDQWSLQPELLYLGKGEQLTLIVPRFGPSPTEARTQYVEVPPFVRMNFASSNPSVRPFAQLGPQVSIRVGCGFLAYCSGFAFNASTIDYGAAAGVGVDTRVRDQVVSFVVRIDAGLRDIEADRAMRNRTVMALLGLRL